MSSEVAALHFLPSRANNTTSVSLHISGQPALLFLHCRGESLPVGFWFLTGGNGGGCCAVFPERNGPQVPGPCYGVGGWRAKPAAWWLRHGDVDNVESFTLQRDPAGIWTGLTDVQESLLMKWPFVGLGTPFL